MPADGHQEREGKAPDAERGNKQHVPLSAQSTKNRETPKARASEASSLDEVRDSGSGNDDSFDDAEPVRPQLRILHHYEQMSKHLALDHHQTIQPHNENQSDRDSERKKRKKREKRKKERISQKHRKNLDRQ